jgi:hypothetical protein
LSFPRPAGVDFPAKKLVSVLIIGYGKRMKNRLLVLTLTSLLAFAVFTPGTIAQQQTQTKTAAFHYNKGRTAFINGRLAEAQQEFSKALGIDPNHAPSIAMMRRVSNAMPKGNAQLLKYKSLIIPKVSFNDATFQSVLDFLREQAVELSGKQIQPNFVVQAADPKKLRNKRITLNLENVPFLEVLRYACGIAQAQFDVQQYAIVVKPLNDTPPQSRAPAGSQQQSGDVSAGETTPTPAQ